MLIENSIFSAIRKKSEKNKRGRNKIKSHVKLGDLVMVISGNDKGKIGEVVSINRDKVFRSVKIKVSGVNLAKKSFSKAKHGSEGFKIVEMYIDSSNVVLHERKSYNKFNEGAILSEDTSSDHENKLDSKDKVDSESNAQQIDDKK